LTDTLQLLEHEICARSILLEQDLTPAPPQLLLDRDQIKQALYNLIRNAIQAMTAGGILHVATSTTDTHFTYTIRDNGTGIAPENIQRIFQPYFTTKPNGTGLGLMIVQRIVREHGGQLQLDTTPGRGTTVRIHLPLHEKRIRLLQPPAQP
ncbi:MAG: ATP-binding protein, partial [Verrucomicrobiae bacterium]|nr:ATP-binding protein [Verrucomicrobiae bacterium]